MGNAIKGYCDQQKSSAIAPQYATLQPVRAQQYALDVLSHATVATVSTGAAEADSTNRTIVATGHDALKGDVISFTSGNLAGYEFRVADVTVDEITLAEVMPEAPAPGDTFDIQRHKYLKVNPDGTLPLPPLPFTPQYPVDTVRITHDTTPITTGAWVELIAALAADVNYITCFSSSGQTLELGTGAAGFEVRACYLPPGGFDAQIAIRLGEAERVSVRAVSDDADAGELQINFMGGQP